MRMPPTYWRRALHRPPRRRLKPNAKANARPCWSAAAQQERRIRARLAKGQSYRVLTQHGTALGKAMAATVLDGTHVMLDIQTGQILAGVQRLVAPVLTGPPAKAGSSTAASSESRTGKASGKAAAVSSDAKAAVKAAKAVAKAAEKAAKAKAKAASMLEAAMQRARDAGVDV